MCNCKLVQLILGIIILVFTFLYSYTDWASWIIAIAAVILILHSLLCKRCQCQAPAPEKKEKKVARKR